MGRRCAGDAARRAGAAHGHIDLVPAAGESSAWHRVRSDEVWLAHTGVVRLELGGDGPSPEPTGTVDVGTAADQVSQALVPAGVWQRTLPGDAEALVSCVVSPGHFDDFDLLPP
jgi:predicted cupin superfamily sugar epimerase